jgi:large subunit ribosomal protein L25
MAEIVLNVELRDGAGTGAARAVRNQDKVPGVLYGGQRGPVTVSVRSNEFRKALYTGKLLGHLVTLKFGDETQPVIAKDVQFHPVTDEPIHFDLYRVDEHQLIRISVPLHFSHQDASPGIKRGGTLNIVEHAIEVRAPADSIPEELVADLTGLEIGDTIRVSSLTMPKGVTPTHDAEFVLATITGATVEVETEEGGEEAQAAEAPEQE